MGKKYDIYFEWSNDTLYCSEYVREAYCYALNDHPELSRPQKFSDIKLVGPPAVKLTTKGYTAAGKKLNMDETIVTRAALETVGHSALAGRAA